MRIDRTERVVVDPATLPGGRGVQRVRAVVVQDLVLRTDTVAFELAVWYSPSERRSYRARRPAGYDGDVRAAPASAGADAGVRRGDERAQDPGAGAEHRDRDLGRDGVEPADRRGGRPSTAEAREVLQAGLASTPYQHLDDTSTRVDGEGQYCQILCNPLYTAYQTTPGKDRRTIIEVLRGGLSRPRTYRFDREADRHLAFLGLSAAARAKLTRDPARAGAGRGDADGAPGRAGARPGSQAAGAGP